MTSNQVAANGSFEQPVIGNGYPGETFNGNWSHFSAGIPSWNATNDCGIEIQTGPTVGTTPADGNQYAELDSNCVSGVNQSVATAPGTQYILSFAYQARPGTNASQNTMAVQWNGAYVVGSATPGSGLQDPFGSWATAQYIVTATSSTTPLEFDSTNPNSGDSYGAFLDNVSLIPVAAQDSNTSWLTAKYLGTPGQVGASQSLNYQGEDLWYDFSVSPGEQLQVSLGSVAGDYNISVFSDISQAFSALNNSSLNLAALGAEAPGNAASPSAFSPSAFSPSAFSPSAFSPSAFSPSAFSPSAFSPSAFSPSAFSPSAFSPSAFSAAYSNAQLDSLLAVSTAPGAVNKSVTVNTWNNTGNFYVRVTGNNGAFAPFMPYNLTVKNLGGPCGPGLNTFPTDSTISGSGGPSYGTVIVTDSTLMPNVAQTYAGTNPMYTPLQQLATATNGVVVDVGKSQLVNDLQAQAQSPTFAGCPYAPDLEASAIQNIINSYRVGNGSNLQNVVIVGDDGVIPFFRYPDNAGLAGESNYQPPLLSTSLPEAALANNYYISQDQYGAANQLTIQGVTVPLPTAAVGRLVQTPADILATVNSYLGGARVISPTSSLSTGYNFMAPPAMTINQSFANGIGGSNNATLINDTWSASQLQSVLTAGHHDLAFLAGHFSANNLLAADQTTTMTTNQFVSVIGNTLRNSLVLGAGCHAGYNIDSADAIPGVTDPLAWPQAFTESGATLISGSGYQYGDTNYTAYSDQLYVQIAQQLGIQPAGGPGPVAIGNAMLVAEQKYLSGVVQLNGIEEKALLETTLYGLPMIGVQEPHQVAAPGGSSSNVVASAVTTNPGTQLGLQQSDVDFGPLGPAPSFSPFTLTPKTVTNGTSSFTYDTGAQGVTAAPGGPVLPVQTYDVNVPSQTLRGVGFRGGSYSDTPGTNPLTGDPATETGNPQVVPFSSPVFFPQTVWNPNYFGTLLNGGDTELALTPVQYVSDPNGASTDTMRTFSDENLRLFYDNNTQKYGTNVPALAASPTISNVTSTVNGNSIKFSANVTGDPSAGIQDVWVTYTGLAGDPNHGQWQSVDLTQSNTDSTLWTATLNFAAQPNIVFMVQAVNGVGEVSLDNNNGYYFTPGVTAGAIVPNLTSHTVALSGATSGTFLGNASVSATLSPNVANAPITFNLGATNVTATTNGSGVATATMPLIEPPGNYTLTASFAGDATDQPAGAQEGFQINQAPTSLTLVAPGTVSPGVNTGATATLTSAGSPLAQKPVYFVLTNSGGTPVGASVGFTNSHGVAQAGPINFTPSSTSNNYKLTAYFGSSTTPLPSGSYNASDPDYSSSTSNQVATATQFTQVYSGTHSGSLTINSGQLVLITGQVTGSVTVNKGGGLEVFGGSISGAVTSNGAVAFTLCNATLGGALSVNGSTGFVFIGGGTGTGCGPTSIGGTTTLSKNTGGVEIANSSINGSLTVSNDSGPSSPSAGQPSEPEVAGNSIVGALSCSGNTPGVTNANQSNTASSKSGQCAAL